MGHGLLLDYLQDFDYVRPVILVELDEENTLVTHASRVRSAMNEMGSISRPCCLSIMRGGLSEKAHSWISFRTEKCDLTPFPGVCCILRHPKHIAAVLKASNFVVHFVVAYRNIIHPSQKN